MTYNELMLQSLSDILEKDETLKYPIYGTLTEKNWHCFGFFGLTDNYLLIALLKGSSKKVKWISRVPLDIKEVKIKKSIIPYQYRIQIGFYDGSSCQIRVSKKVLGIKSQEINLKEFLEYIQYKQKVV